MALPTDRPPGAVKHYAYDEDRDHSPRPNGQTKLSVRPHDNVGLTAMTQRTSQDRQRPSQDRSRPSQDVMAEGGSKARSKSGGRRPSGQQKVCGKCGEHLTGQFVRALGDTYHLECFTCHVGHVLFVRDIHGKAN